MLDILYSSAFHITLFYHFLFSRYLDLPEHHFGSILRFECFVKLRGFSGPLMQICINLSRFLSLNDERSGVQIKFMAEKPCSAFDVEGRINTLFLSKTVIGAGLSMNGVRSHSHALTHVSID